MDGKISASSAKSAVEKSRASRRGVFENIEDFSRRSRGAETFAHGAVVEKFRDGRQRAQVGLELIFRHDEKDDEFHRRIIERVELDARARPAKGGHDFFHAV